MKTLSLSEVKMKLSDLLEMVRVRGKEIVITKNGQPVAVLVSLEEFDSWKETVAIRWDAALMREIKAGLSALKGKKTKLYTLEDLFK
jgi:antitoxin YefM